MSALVTSRGFPPERRHYAQCDECAWRSDEYPENIAAYADCRAHNAALHDFESFELAIPPVEATHSLSTTNPVTKETS